MQMILLNAQRNSTVVFQDKDFFITWRTKSGKHIPILGAGDASWSVIERAAHHKKKIGVLKKKGGKSADTQIKKREEALKKLTAAKAAKKTPRISKAKGKEPWKKTRSEFENSLPDDSDKFQFMRAPTKGEKKGGAARNKGYGKVEPKEGHEVVYKPWGEKGEGYYQTPITKKSPEWIRVKEYKRHVEEAIVKKKPVSKEVAKEAGLEKEWEKTYGGGGTLPA